MSSHFNDTSTTIEHAFERSSSPSVPPEDADVSGSGAAAGSTSNVGPAPVPFSKPPNQISNLTKTLLSSSTNSNTSSASSAHQIRPGSIDHGVPAHPPSYTSFPSSLTNSTSNSKIPGNPIPFQQNSFQNSASSYHQYSTPLNDSINYIPSSHNTPTVVSSSYSSNHSATPSVQNNSFIQSSNNFQHLQPHSSSYKAPGILPHAIPTTNISMESATSRDGTNSFSQHNSFSNSSQGGLFIPQQQQQQRFPSSLPGNGGFGSAPSFLSNQPQQQPQNSFYNNPRSSVGTAHQNNSSSSLGFQQQQHPPQNRSASSFHSQTQDAPASIEPDHYMSYQEFLHNLSTKDGAGSPSNVSPSATNGNNDSGAIGGGGSIYEEHLNIVDYPVNDLILMLSCLLTKIIEANDKLHPNHFDNTIAIRQRMKEEKRLKKLQRTKLKEEKKANRQKQRDENAIKKDIDDDDDKIDVDVDNYHNNTIEVDEVPDDAIGDEDIDEDDDDDLLDKEDEDDEMKNKYLANVLAFHGTNVPGISLHAYLARILKYCPVTNEVFLSLLVYFDRIAKKANNLKQKKKDNESESGSEGTESEQLFVMDSFNIHRLIISGITVSSKFFSDIFYKNLRYAKVGGLPLEELNYLELQFLLLLDFKLMISVEDLQNYGDLLLRFWKREQITNELVHNNTDPQPQN